MPLPDVRLRRCIDRFMRVGGVPPFTGDVDGKQIGGGEKRPWPDGKSAGGIPGQLCIP